MSDEKDIPILTDLIERGVEIKMSDLGLDDSLYAGIEDPLGDSVEMPFAAPDIEVVDPLQDNPALEQAVRRILDEHMELAWQEIKLAIQHHLKK
jgi:hypothetical protein